MKTWAKIHCSILFLIGLQAQAQPGSNTVAYSTFDSSGGYNVNSGWLVDGTANPPQPYVAEAFQFRPAVSGYLAQIDLAIATDHSSDLANIYVAANSVNIPGKTLESFMNVTVAGPFGFNNPVTTLSSVLQPYLTAGTTYWLWVQAATPQSVLTVNQNDIGVNGVQAQSFSVNSWTVRGLQSAFAYDIEVSSVPEPSTAVLALLGISALIRRALKK